MQEKIGGDERTLLADSEDGMAAEDEIVDFVVDDYSLNRLDLDDSRERIETEDGSLLPAETWSCTRCDWMNRLMRRRVGEDDSNRRFKDL